MTIDEEINALLQTFHAESEDESETDGMGNRLDGLPPADLTPEEESILDEKEMARRGEIDEEIAAEIEATEKRDDAFAELESALADALSDDPEPVPTFNKVDMMDCAAGFHRREEGEPCEVCGLHEPEPFAPGADTVGDYVATEAAMRAAADLVLTGPDGENIPAPPAVDAMQAALQAAEAFISGFEDDETQEGIPALLASIRALLPREPEAAPVLRDYRVTIGADVRCYATHVVAARSPEEARQHFMDEIESGGFPLSTFMPEEVQGDISMAVEDGEFVEMETDTPSYLALESALAAARDALLYLAGKVDAMAEAESDDEEMICREDMRSKIAATLDDIQEGGAK